MEGERRSRSSVKRKPLSDRTNLSSSSLFLKPPQNPNPKPYNSSSYTNKKSDTNSSKSDTSVASSKTNYNKASNPTTILQPTNPGIGNGEIFESVVIYGLRQSVEKTKCNGKGVTSFPPLDKTKDEGKAVAVDFRCPTLLDSKDKGKAVVVLPGCSSIENSMNKRKSATVSFSPPQKRKEAGKAVDVPFGYPTTENTMNKGKAVHVPSSCPHPLRMRTIRDKLNDAEDICQSKSCKTHPKNKKKRYCLPEEQDVSRHALPLDFIEQQRAYFKEVDEFELPEEEVTYDSLDE